MRPFDRAYMAETQRDWDLNGGFGPREAFTLAAKLRAVVAAWRKGDAGKVLEKLQDAEDYEMEFGASPAVNRIRAWIFGSGGLKK